MSTYTLPPAIPTDLPTWEDLHDIGDGWSVRVEILPDEDWSIFDDGDWYGRLAWAETDRYSGHYVRPDWADGSARLLRSFGRYATIDGVLWWLPPRDVVKMGADAVDELERCLMRDIDDGAVGVVVHLVAPDGDQSAPFSLWGVTGWMDDKGCLSTIVQELAEEARADVLADLARTLGTVPAILEGVGA